MTLKVGFIGYGFMGKAHANALDRLPMFFPEAIGTDRHILAGTDEEQLPEASNRLGFSEWTTDWREVIETVDVLYNLTPNNMHAEPTIEALRSDTHVLCEKPLARSVEEAKEMHTAAQRSSASAACAFNYRYVPALQYAKQLINQGVLGDIRRFRGEYMVDGQANPDRPWNWRNDAKQAGYGQLSDCGSHTIDLAQWLISDISRVSGDLTTVIEERPVRGSSSYRDVTTDDAYSALIAFDCGARGVLEASRVATGYKATNSIEVIGSKGALRFDLKRLNELEVYNQEKRGFERILVTDPDDPYMHTWWPPGHTIGWEHTVIHENYEFLKAIEGERENIPTFKEALKTQKIIEAIWNSDKNERWVDIS